MTNRTRSITGKDTGSLIVETLLGLFVGALVIGAFVMFWSGASRSAKDNTNGSVAEAAAVKTLTIIGRDVQDADQVMVASNTEMVIEKRGKTTISRTRYTVKTVSGKKNVTKQVWPNAPTTYDYSAAGTTAWATTARPEVSIGFDLSVDLTDTFLFFNRDGTGLPAPTGTPLLGNGAAKNIKRVDLHYKGIAGKKGGFVELKSSASVNKKDGDNGAISSAAIPACPTPVTVNATGTTVTFTGVSGASTYTVTVTGGASSAPITVNDTGAASYSATVPASNIAPAGSNGTYTVTATGPGGTSSGCVGTVWAHLPDEPVVLGVVDATGDGVTLTWPVVTGASGYTVFRRAASATTFTGTVAFTSSGTPTTVTTTGGIVKWTLPLAFGTAGEYYVIALSPVGSSASSNRFGLLAEPAVPALVASVSDYNENAADATSDVSADKIQFTRGWTATAGTSGAGDPGGWRTSSTSWMATAVSGTKKAATYNDVLTSGGVNATNQLMLGNNYYYTARANNNGPRTSTEFAAGTASDMASDWSTAAADSPQMVQQYPPDIDSTATTATGSEVNADGTNRITWEKSTHWSVTGYKIFRTWKNVTGSYAAADGVGTYDIAGVNTLAYDNTGLSRATRVYYLVAAVNTTGVSPVGSDLNTTSAAKTTRKSAYQLPGNVQALTYTSAALRPTAASNTANIQWDMTQGAAVGATDNTPSGYIPSTTAQPDYPDYGNTFGNHGAFCTTTTTDYAACRYEVLSSTDTVLSTTNINSRTAPVSGLAYGAATTLKVRACNRGGCSTPRTISIESFPQAFSTPSTAITGTNTLRQYGSSTSAEGYSNYLAGGSANDSVAKYDYDRGITSAQWDAYDIRPQSLSIFNQYNSDGTEQAPFANTSKKSALIMRWSASAGTGLTYDYDYYAENDGYDYAANAVVTDGGRGRSSAVTGTALAYSGSAGGIGHYTTPGSRTYYTVRAVAANGLYRYWDAPSATKFRASKAAYLLTGMTATGTYPGVSVQNPNITPSYIENKGLCLVSESPAGSGKYVKSSTYWGSEVYWNDTVVDGSADKNNNVKIDKLYVRNGAVNLPSGVSDAERVDTATRYGYSATTDYNNSSLGWDGTWQGHLNVHDYTQTTANTPATLVGGVGSERFGSNNNYLASRRINLTYKDGVTSTWNLRGWATPAANEQAATAADYGYGWSANSLWSDGQSSDGNTAECPLSLQISTSPFAGSPWRHVNGSSYSYNAGVIPKTNQ